MSWPAYYDLNTGSPAFNTSTTYEGYFTPTSVYQYNSSNGYWQETTGTASACPSFGSNPSTSNLYTGNCLNYKLMARIDLVRWAVTGGAPSTCTGSNTFNYGSCDVELWQDPGMNGSGKVGTICDSGGCELQTDGGTQVKVPWNRLDMGLANVFENLSVIPRMGAMFFSNSGVNSSGKVYVGDFTGPNSTAAQYPFRNLITAINSSTPGGGTPTGPAMWDTYNYFSQNPPQYGGIPAQSGSGDRWKNPLYVCDGGGSNCVLTSCAKNYVILLSDGQWNTPSCSISDGVSDPVQPAYTMHKGFTNAGANVSTSVNAVYTIGLFLSGTGMQAMKNIAMYGSFDTTGRTWPDSLTGYPQSTCNMNDCGNGSGSGCTALPASSPDWDSNADSAPDTYYSASNASEIKNAILNAVLDALRRASSGTAVSMLSSSGGSGANLLQAVFYPQRAFGDTEIAWTGEIQNLWYYLDPYLQNETIREDTNSDKKLNIAQDYVLQFYFDSSLNKSRVKRYSDNGSGSLTYVDTIDIENINNLWAAGKLLWSQTSARTVYTTTDGASFLSGNFAAANASTLQSYLQASNTSEATNIINYVLGADQSGYRNRTVSISGSSGVWKLGDVISSTPKIESSTRLNTYHLQSPQGYNDLSYATFIGSKDYLTRGMVFTGANDGMLHAFKLGTLDQSQSGNQKASICNDDADKDGKCDSSDSTSGLGTEQWAFIPKNSLPYLKYLTDPNYCHLYYVDGPLYLFDASIAAPAAFTGNYWDSTRASTVDGSNNLTLDGTSWRTLLIGSMGLGGACRYSSGACNTVSGVSGDQCVKSPVTDNGLSSYFALDVTNPQTPSLMWEFSNADLGYSLTGPAIIRISPKTDTY
ncbi:MAG TPA: hypothetical protein VF790_00575, partial [Dissulfurispiraceae bacterium]